MEPPSSITPAGPNGTEWGLQLELRLDPLPAALRTLRESRMGRGTNWMEALSSAARAAAAESPVAPHPEANPEEPAAPASPGPNGPHL